MTDIQNTIQLLQKNTERTIGFDALSKKLEENKILKVKFGVDPTRPDLTFGHLVVFKKLRQFQDMGHQAILLIGDYTARIGDPSGRSTTRPMLSKEDISLNTQTYLEQAFKILDKNKTIVRYNSEWLEPMSLADTLKLTSIVTVARMLERDDFSKRYADNSPISIVEFLYPLLQAYDSVVLEADIELGGNDQLFNLLMGRVLQKEFGQSEQAILCMPLLVGLDGVRKMSKSYDNYIAFNDTAKDMFGKIMSISDDTMWNYYSLLLGKEEDYIVELKKSHPMQSKKQLALEFVKQFHGEQEAYYQLDQFEHVFSKKEIPDDITTFEWEALSIDNTNTLSEIIYSTRIFESKKEIRRLIEQGGVKVDNNKQLDPFYLVKKIDQPIIVQAGKRTFFKII